MSESFKMNLRVSAKLFLADKFTGISAGFKKPPDKSPSAFAEPEAAAVLAEVGSPALAQHIPADALGAEIAARVILGKNVARQPREKIVIEVRLVQAFHNISGAAVKPVVFAQFIGDKAVLSRDGSFGFHGKLLSERRRFCFTVKISAENT